MMTMVLIGFALFNQAPPSLPRQGYVVEVDSSFNYDVVDAEEKWDADATAGSDFWFSLDLGVTVEGRRVPLLPIIHQAIKRLRGQNPLAEIERLNVEGKFYAPLGDGRYVALPFDRVKAVVLILLEIFDRDMSLVKAAPQVNLAQIMELAAQISPNAADAAKDDGSTSGGWLIGSKLSTLIEKIRRFGWLRVGGTTAFIPGRTATLSGRWSQLAKFYSRIWSGRHSRR